MDKVINCLFAAITLLLSVRGEVFKGKEDYLGMFARTEHVLFYATAGGRSTGSKALKLSFTAIFFLILKPQFLPVSL